MLEPAVIIVVSALLVKFFIFFPAIILYARKAKHRKALGWISPPPTDSVAPATGKISRWFPLLPHP